MNNQELRERAEKLLDRLDASAPWRNAGMWHVGRASQAIRVAVERIALLLGSQEPDLAAGEVNDDGDDLTGWMLVITEDRLIYADVWPSDGSFEPRVEAVSLVAVNKVDVNFVQTRGLDDSPWPANASITLHLSKELGGVTEITVGKGYQAGSVLARDIANVAGRLPLR